MLLYGRRVHHPVIVTVYVLTCFWVNVLRPPIAIRVYTSLSRYIMYRLHTDLTGLSLPRASISHFAKSQHLLRRSISKRGSKAVYLKKNEDAIQKCGERKAQCDVPNCGRGIQEIDPRYETITYVQ